MLPALASLTLTRSEVSADRIRRCSRSLIPSSGALHYPFRSPGLFAVLGSPRVLLALPHLALLVLPVASDAWLRALSLRCSLTGFPRIAQLARAVSADRTFRSSGLAAARSLSARAQLRSLGTFAQLTLGFARPLGFSLSGGLAQPLVSSSGPARRTDPLSLLFSRSLGCVGDFRAPLSQFARRKRLVATVSFSLSRSRSSLRIKLRMSTLPRNQPVTQQN